jgi:dissimilatory sulfite reductase (desulfoviridin) alpha/beta subunit
MAGSVHLRNKTLLLTTEAPGGIYNSNQLKKIAELCDSESVIVKATEDQRLAVFVPEDKLETVRTELESIGLGIRQYQEGLHQPTTCIGEMCSLHEQDALGTAMDLTADLDNLKVKNPLKIGINGCGRCCVPTHTLDISVIGSKTGYQVNLGGRSSQIPEMASFAADGVPAAEVSGLIKKIVLHFKKLAQPGENLQAVMERCGPGQFIQLLAPYSQDASIGNDFSPMADFGESAEEMPASDELADPLESDPLVNDPLAADPLADDLDLESEFDVPVATADADTSGLDIDPNSFDSDPAPIGEIPIESVEDDLDALVEEDLNQSPAPAAADGEMDELADLENEPEFAAADISAADIAATDLAEADVATPDFAGVEEDFESMPEGQVDELDLSDLESMPDSGESGEPVETELEAVVVDDGLDEFTAADFASEPVAIEEESAPMQSAASFESEELGADMPDEFSEASEVVDSEADAFEEKLSESIADEGMVQDDVDNSSQEEALRLVENTAAASDDSESMSAQSGSSWEFAGVDVEQSGVVVRFTGGGVMKLPFDRMQGRSRNFKIGNASVTVSPDSSNVTVDVDGVEVTVPRNAA